MTAKKATGSTAKDLRPRSIKSGSKEAGSIKGGVMKLVDASTPKLHDSSATVDKK